MSDHSALLVRFRVASGLQNLLATEASKFEETSMDLRFRMALAALISIGFFSCALAQDGKHDPVSAAATETRTLTGKERLGPKWTDEQRIDNCHVPVEKRGFKPRPSACPNGPST
jgi:hypothetical protein